MILLFTQVIRQINKVVVFKRLVAKKYTTLLIDEYNTSKNVVIDGKMQKMEIQNFVYWGVRIVRLIILVVQKMKKNQYYNHTVF